MVGLAQQIPQELPVDAPRETQVLHFGRPADVDAQRPGFILIRTPWEVDGLHTPQAPQRLRQALEANTLAHQAEVQDPQPLALGQARPAVDREAGLRRDEHLQPLLRAAQQPRRRRLGALMDYVRQIEDAHEVGEVLLLDVREHRGADGADEELVRAAGQEGRVVQRLDRYVVPLPTRAVVSMRGLAEALGESSCVPIYRAEGRERGLLGPRVPGLYVGQDFEEDFIGQVVCVRGHGKDAALEGFCGDYRYPKNVAGWSRCAHEMVDDVLPPLFLTPHKVRHGP